MSMGSAARVYRSLQGLFAVYKPPGVHWKLVRDTVETNLIRDLNSLGSPAPRQAIRFLPGRSEGADRSELTLTAARLPVLADHPLVLGVGHGNKMLTGMYSCHLTKEYTLQGLFGKATDDFSDSGRLVEKTTFDHITRDKLEKILAVIQGTNQKALLAFSGVDLKSQEAYEMAVKGLLRPLQKTPPVITGVRCVRFAPPEFTLEIQCLNETPQYLRKLIHEIGLELRSAAVCSHVRRTRDGFFTLPDALLRSHWDLHSVGEAVRQAGPRVRAALSRGEAEETDPGEGRGSGAEAEPRQGCS
ncbi:mitochondrial mRNA pseudouridine synthase TRUB2 isoform X3 [Polyodon spathula]|uniref:mitochondrial mRNA pseudouridine synthase TRUB2 isoform X3 n=1 Tax=Polyodon spathula TaxID=7913 RepID=UPI001B7E9E00|nr:mitochondrial mRNA pseudouridine synthase TRUB2 isoform X3 [Polyodon spathula]